MAHAWGGPIDVSPTHRPAIVGLPALSGLGGVRLHRQRRRPVAPLRPHAGGAGARPARSGDAAPVRRPAAPARAARAAAGRRRGADPARARAQGGRRGGGRRSRTRSAPGWRRCRGCSDCTSCVSAASLARMDVLIAGGHGQIARRLIRLLARDGHTARGLIRNPDHAADIEADGGVAVLCDLEHDDVEPFVAVTPTRSCSPPALGPARAPSASAPSISAPRSSASRRPSPPASRAS